MSKLRTTPQIQNLGWTFAGMLILAAVTGKMHDYVSYGEQWASIARGEIPWRPFVVGVDPQWNSYGPLFLLFSPLYQLDQLLPKIMFVGAWLGGFLLLKSRGDRARWTKQQRFLTIYWLLSPFFWIDVVLYGHFDVLVALLTVGAGLALKRRRDVLAGFLFAAGVLLKFVPLALLPVFIFVDGRLRWRFLAVTLGLIGIGMLIPYSIWGEATFYPLVMSAQRGAKLLSIFAYLEGDYSVLPWLGVNGQVPTAYSVPLIAIFSLAMALLNWLIGLDVLLGGLLVSLTTVAFYKVGHLQFYAMPLVFLLFWLAETGLVPLADQRLARAAMSFLWWFAWVSLFYIWTGGFRAGHWVIARELIGLPTFFIVASLVWQLVRYSLANPHLRTKVPRRSQDLTGLALKVRT